MGQGSEVYVTGNHNSYWFLKNEFNELQDCEEDFRLVARTHNLQGA